MCYPAVNGQTMTSEFHKVV